MSSRVKIKRSETAGNPAVLGQGELAYSALTDNGSNGGDRLYIGTGTETAGNAVNHVVIGGKYFTDKLDHTPGILTASSALITDSSSKLDNIKVDNIDINGNTISSTDANGNIVITPNGSGSVVLDGQNWPQAVGSNGQILTTNGTGQLAWSNPASSSFTIEGDTGSDVFNTGETLKFAGGEGIDTSVSSATNTVTISAEDATSSNKGVASFNTANFTVTSGDVTIKDAGVSNTKLVNSSVTVGTSSVALGATITSLVGLTELQVDNLNINGNTISSTDTNSNIVISPNGSGVVDVSDSRITGVALPTQATDAVNKTYVDNAITGLTFKAAVNLYSSTNVALTGSSSTLVIDGHSALDQTDTGYRILLVNQTIGSQNGIYIYSDNATTYTLTRSADADTYQELIGASVYVLEGTTFGGTGWVQTNHYLTDFTGQTWIQFTGGGSYAAGEGLTLDGTTFNVGAGEGIAVTANVVNLANTVAGNGLTYTTGVINAVGTADRITVSADSIDIASTYVGQTSITTLGTVTTGTWSADTIATTKGGTGLTSYATGDILYASGTNTLAKLSAGTDGKILQINGSGIPVWADIDGGTY